MKQISDFGMRISDFVFGNLKLSSCARAPTGEPQIRLSPNTKSEIRIPKSEIESQ